MDLHNIKLVIQWRYVGSLCTLVQRFGHDGRNLSDEALAIYLVEPKYFDRYTAKKKKQKSTAKGSAPRKRHKQKNNEPMNITLTDAHEDVEADSASITATVYRTESLFLPAWSSLSEAEYEVVAMDWFINAQTRSVCLHKILDEYFGNNDCGENFSYDLTTIPP